MSCKLCEEFYKRHPLKEGNHVLSKNSYMDPIKCAFEGGIFQEDNWNCRTITRLMELAKNESNEHTYFWTDVDNGTIYVIPLPYDKEERNAGYLVMTGYKERGTIEKAFITWMGNPLKELTLEVAEKILEDENKEMYFENEDTISNTCKYGKYTKLKTLPSVLRCMEPCKNGGYDTACYYRNKWENQKDCERYEPNDME